MTLNSIRILKEVWVWEALLKIDNIFELGIEFFMVIWHKSQIHHGFYSYLYKEPQGIDVRSEQMETSRERERPCSKLTIFRREGYQNIDDSMSWFRIHNRMLIWLLTSMGPWVDKERRRGFKIKLKTDEFFVWDIKVKVFRHGSFEFETDVALVFKQPWGEGVKIVNFEIRVIWLSD